MGCNSSGNNNGNQLAALHALLRERRLAEGAASDDSLGEQQHRQQRQTQQPRRLLMASLANLSPAAAEAFCRVRRGGGSSAGAGIPMRGGGGASGSGAAATIPMCGAREGSADPHAPFLGRSASCSPAASRPTRFSRLQCRSSFAAVEAALTVAGADAGEDRGSGGAGRQKAEADGAGMGGMMPMPVAPEYARRRSLLLPHSVPLTPSRSSGQLSEVAGGAASTAGAGAAPGSGVRAGGRGRSASVSLIDGEQPPALVRCEGIRMCGSLSFA